MRKGFTIVELLMVIAIIGILLGLSVTAVTGVIQKAREQQTDACVTLVNQGAAAYYTVKGEWPGNFKTTTDRDDLDYHELTGSEVKESVLAMVKEARDGRPPMDISGLFVSSKPGEGGKAYGMDFMTAIHGTKKHPTKMSSGNMYFGYPEKNHGYFRRFAAKYYPKTDRLVFDRQEQDK